jgi:hypothetical protein
MSTYMLFAYDDQPTGGIGDFVAHWDSADDDEALYAARQKLHERRPLGSFNRIELVALDDDGPRLVSYREGSGWGGWR